MEDTATQFKLYVAGQTAKSERARRNLAAIVEEHFDGVELEVIDLLEQPHRATTDQIVAIPTLVRLKPRAIIVGDLSDSEKVLRSLGTQAL